MKKILSLQKLSMASNPSDEDKSSILSCLLCGGGDSTLSCLLCC